MLDDGKWLGIPDTKLFRLVIELGTLDPMLLVIIVGNSKVITVSQEYRPWLVKMEERLFRFVLTDILGNLESSAALGAPDTVGDSLGIVFPSLTGTALATVDDK